MAELGAEHRDAMETATEFEVGVGGESFGGAWADLDALAAALDEAYGIAEAAGDPLRPTPAASGRGGALGGRGRRAPVRGDGSESRTEPHPSPGQGGDHPGRVVHRDLGLTRPQPRSETADFRRAYTDQQAGPDARRPGDAGHTGDPKPPGGLGAATASGVSREGAQSVQVLVGVLPRRVEMFIEELVESAT